jgi:hypothetical protein
MKFVDISGDCASKKKKVVWCFTEASPEWSREMTSGAKDKAIDKHINKVDAK